MSVITTPTLLAFLLQSIIFMIPIPVSYAAYRWVRLPLKRNQIKYSLSLLGVSQRDDLEKRISSVYKLKDYFWPVGFACVIAFVTFAQTHPYIISLGWTAGIWEEITDLFGVGNLYPRALLHGRIAMMGWFGAWLYSLQMIFRRFLSYDLTPSVYIYAAIRLLQAYVLGSVVGPVVGSLSELASHSFVISLGTAYVVAFFIGYFPEQGINWITVTAQKALRQRQRLVKEKPLSEVEGLSIWHQGRLKQEGVENAQNLATIDIPSFVISTPFALGQIIDWVDQAILLVSAYPAQFEALEKIGISCASDFIASTDNEEQISLVGEACHLDKNELKTLYVSLQSAPNISVVTHYKWQSSLSQQRRHKAESLQLL